METETPSLQLATRCEQRSTDTNNSKAKKSLISEWVVRFALNAEKALDAKEQAVYRSMWEEGFSDVEAGRLKAAFVACLRSHTYRTMPTIGDVRQHLSRAEERSVSLEAEEKWQQVLRYAQTTSPDYQSKPVRIREQTRVAINAAGGLSWIRDCPESDLQWARKRFVEKYVEWSALKKDEYLLPAGELNKLIADAAQKLLPEAKP